MIGSWFLDVAELVITWFFSLFPEDFEVPEFITGLANIVGDVLANAHGLGVWIPWVPIALVVGAVVAVWFIGVVIKFVRWLVGLIPTMGGG